MTRSAGSIVRALFEFTPDRRRDVRFESLGITGVKTMELNGTVWQAVFPDGRKVPVADLLK